MIPMISSTKKKGKNRGALIKSRNELAALVDTQLNIDKQRDIQLITPPVTGNRQFTYHASHHKGDQYQ